MKLKGKVAVITGGSRGIGRAIAHTFAREGATVVIVATHQETADKTVNEIKSLGFEALPVKADVSNAAQVNEMIKATMQKFGKIDILVNNAGIFMAKPSEDVTEEEWDKIVDVDLKGVFLCAQAACKVMMRHGGGKIVNIASIQGMQGFPERAAYSASKAGVIALTKVLAIDWAKYGITVNAISPGYVKTEQIEERIKKGAFSEESLAKRTLLKRMADPSEIASAALFLVSDESKYVTGHNLAVDGGWTAYGYL